MKTDNSRARILNVYRFLKEHSDKDHPVNTEEIIKELEKNDIKAERKAIYNDIESLCSAGIMVEHTGKPKRGYYYAGREFETTEVKLLIDAILSADFVPKKKSKQLVTKLECLVSTHEAEELRSGVCIENRSKSNNEAVYDIINELNKAIIKKVKVKISYTKNRLNGNKLEAVTKDMTINPYALVWEANRYYLIGNNAKYDNITHLRVDRIAEIKTTNEPIRHFSEVSPYAQRFDTADYSRKTFNMFGGEICRIDLECRVELLDQITDKFTDGIFIRHFDNEESFRFTADVLVSEGLVGWIMQFGGKIKVLSPESLKTEVKKNAEKLLEAYK